MVESSQKNIILMAFLALTRDDVFSCASELGMSEEQVTEEVIELVTDRVSQRLSSWRDVVRGMVKEAIKCPLNLVCSSSCAWGEVGECIFRREV